MVTPTPTTPIAEGRALVEHSGASSLPWHVEIEPEDARSWYICHPMTMCSVTTVAELDNEANAALIVAAVNDYPAHLDLEARNAALENEVGRLREVATTADYLIYLYQQIAKRHVVRDLAEAEGAYHAAQNRLALKEQTHED